MHIAECYVPRTFVCAYCSLVAYDTVVCLGHRVVCSGQCSVHMAVSCAYGNVMCILQCCAHMALLCA